MNLSVPTQSSDLRCSDSLSSRRHPTPTHVGLAAAWSYRLPADARSGSIKLLLSACCVQSPELCRPEKTLVHPAPIMCLLKENIGPSHIPGLPFPPVPTHGLRGSKEPLRALVRPTGHNKKASPLVQTHNKGRKHYDLKPSGVPLPTGTSAGNGGETARSAFPKPRGSQPGQALPPHPQCTRLAWPTLTACSGRCTH